MLEEIKIQHKKKIKIKKTTVPSETPIPSEIPSEVTNRKIYVNSNG
jgi:hypothetical protein